MSIRTAEHEGSAAWRVSLPLCAAAAIYALLLVLGARLLNDPDVYWHIAVGRWMVEHRAFPHVDMFSATVAGAPWIAKEWLSQLLYAGAHAVAGWSGVVILAACAAAAGFALLADFLLQKLAPLAAPPLVGAGFVLVAPHLQARPHALALPLMVVWVGVLVNAVDHRRAPPLALLPVMTLWANLHGSFTLGRGAGLCVRARVPPHGGPPPPRPAAGAASRHDAVGEPAWQLHPRLGAPRAARARGVAECGCGAARDRAQLAPLRRVGAGCRVRDPLWAGTHLRRVAGSRPRSDSLDDRRGAGAGLQPDRRIRGLFAARPRLRALPRHRAAAAAHRHAARIAAPRIVAGAPRGRARPARSIGPGAPARAPIRTGRRRSGARTPAIVRPRPRGVGGVFGRADVGAREHRRLVTARADLPRGRGRRHHGAQR